MYLAESVVDYSHDIEELHYLLTDSIRRLQRYISDIKKVKKHITPSTYEEVSIAANVFIEACRKHDRLLSEGNTILAHKPPTQASLEHAEKIKKEVSEFLRTHQTQFGALITSTDWQSPSFLHSKHSQAGRETGRIQATINDYKRDQHWDAYNYEQSFLNHYIDSIIKFPIHIHATSSGMAAFATILNFLMLEGKATGPILIGKSIYFENKALILRAFPKKIIEVDESNTDAVIHAINTYHPCVLVFDSLSNSSDIAVPNLTVITKYLISHCKKETFLVIDNTCLSVAFQPFPLFFGKRTGLRLIMFESLNKYHQFGFDRVTGGMIAAWGGDTGKLFDYRVHLGTNISDVITASLPTPNRKMLMRRLSRHHRNTLLLATQLHAWIIDHPKSPFESIMFPGLPHHPSFLWNKHTVFSGSYCTIQFKKRYQTIPNYKRFVSMAIDMAKRQNIDLVSGTSFGMNTTRIYLTAVRSKPTTPFVRISVGTETRQAFEAVITTFLKSLSSFT